jgi:methionyl-tRNA formyltransferase
MRILVFTSKLIGLQLIDFLFSEFNDDEYIFIVSNPDSTKIIEAIKKNGHKYMNLNDSTIKWINKQDEKSFDWLLNLWGSYIFTKETILKSKRSLNVHPSYLPFGRGSDPVVWAVRYAHPAGVTLHEISEHIDDGPILYQEVINYDFPISGGQLYNLVIKKCIDVFSQQWPLIRVRQTIGKSQHEGHEYKTMKRKDLINDNLLNLDKDEASKELLLKILAHDFDDDYSIKLLYSNKKYSLRLLIEPIGSEDDYE